MSLKEKRPGFFISFEGADGTGKSTQIDRLADRLRQCGRDVVVTREPGGSPGAEAVRKLLVTGAADRWSPLSEALLMYAARADHLEQTIRPALARGAVVITDRFADSTMAYQGIAGATGEETIRKLHDIVVGADQPDLTILLDLTVEEALRRAGARGGDARFESKGEAFQARVRAAFLEIARQNPERCAVIAAGGAVDEIFERVLKAVEKKAPALFDRRT